MLGGGPTPKPPPPPPPPAAPPTYASSVFAPPSTNTGIGGIFGSSITSSPLGAPDQRTTQRKALFGQ